MGGITETEILQAVSVAVGMTSVADSEAMVPDYDADNVSKTVIQLIQSYTKMVDKDIWRK